MTAVVVFVDDAVTGDFPSVCARTGDPADMVLRVNHPVGGGLNPAWFLLVFLGPPGWIVLGALAVFTPRGEVLTVRVPYTEAAFRRYRTLQAQRLACVGLAVMAAVSDLVFLPTLRPVGFVVAAASVVGALVVNGAVGRASVELWLDASRRWVTLGNVHPAFVAAVLSTPSHSRPARH